MREIAQSSRADVGHQKVGVDTYRTILLDLEYQPSLRVQPREPVLLLDPYQSECGAFQRSGNRLCRPDSAQSLALGKCMQLLFRDIYGGQKSLRQSFRGL